MSRITQFKMKELLTNFSFINIPFTQKTDYYWKKLPQNSSTTVITLKEIFIEEILILSKFIKIYKKSFFK